MNPRPPRPAVPVNLVFAWTKIGGRSGQTWAAVSEGRARLTVSRSVSDGTWSAIVDPPPGLFGSEPVRTKGCRTRLIAQGWAERAAGRFG